MADILTQGPIFLLSLVFMLGIVVVIHELGHYFAGRMFGAAVESFSIGFGRPIYQRTDKRGTRWRINWIPLGGFVKFVGESQLPGDAGKVEAGPVGKPYPQISVGGRSIVSIAGPAANFALSIVLFALLFGFNGVTKTRLTVVGLAEGDPAIVAGMEVGDIFVEIDGKPVQSEADITLAIVYATGVALPMVMERSGELVELTVTPTRRVRDNQIGQSVPQGTIGISYSRLRDSTTHRSLNPVEALGMGVTRTGEVLVMTTSMLSRIVTGKEPLNTLTGPVGIGDAGRRLVTLTMERTDVPIKIRLSSLFWNIIGICAAVSIGIGFFNLLPLPVLDGGHLVFNAYEAVTGKVMPEKVQEVALMAGLGLLLTMFVFITWGDILETGLFNRSAG